MPQRIAYWTSAFESEMEAIAAEVAALRRRFPASVAWGLSDCNWVMLSRRRGYCLHPRLHLVFRAATRALEPLFHINHIFGSLGDWFYLRGARRRPTVLTMAAVCDPVAKPLLDHVDRFVVEYPAGREDLERLGIDRGRIRLIFPPTDLGRFAPAEAPEGPFTVLFASSPERASWLESRGVMLILEAAALRPAMRFRLLWRPWGDSLSRVRRWIAERGLSNVEVVVGRAADMPLQYRRASVTVAPFTRIEHCKPAPNSLVESLACGRPVVATPVVGLAEMISEERVGIVCAASGLALAESFDRLQSDWSSFSARARRTAERWFALEEFLGGYQRLYRELIRSPRRIRWFPPDETCHPGVEDRSYASGD
jgi:glycosyltransferase involved in cell wall biosynthesis